MPRLTRRSFFGWLGGFLAAVGFTRRRAAQGPPSLDDARLRALAEAVLPAALGKNGIEVAAAAFLRWAAGYRPGAELLHGYGTGDIRVAGASPARRWAEQLSALDQAARTAHEAPFARLTVAQRQALVRSQLPADVSGRLPSPLGAPHIALALMAHFYQSPGATDLCYERQIGKNRCRPLVHASREPLPLARPRAERGP